MQLLKVSTDKLLLVAGIVWLIAGANIVNIGLSAFLDETGWLFWVLIQPSCSIHPQHRSEL